jgi:hypothetical protein
MVTVRRRNHLRQVPITPLRAAGFETPFDSEAY